MKKILEQVRLTAQFFLLVYQRFTQEKCFQVAGSLTYTTLLALVPLITVVLTVMSAFPVFSGFSTSLKDFVVANLVPTSAGKVITVYMQQFADNAARLTAVGVVFLAVTSIMLMLTIDQAFNTIWRVRRPRPLLNRVLTYWSVLTIGPILIGCSLSLTSRLVSVSLGIVQGESGVSVMMLRLVPLVLEAVAFAFLYHAVPNRKVAVADATIGGMIAALAFEGMKLGFGAFIANLGSYKLVYGAFASVPIFLLWIYLSWVVVIFAAVITAILPYWLGGGLKLKKYPGSKFVEGLEVLELLCDAHQSGRVLNLEQIRQSLKLTWEETESILETFESAGWVSKLHGNGWVLSLDAEGIRMAELFRLFVFRVEKDAGVENPRIAELMVRIDLRMSDLLGLNFREWLQLRGRPASRRQQPT
jgi:membrane protein